MSHSPRRLSITRIRKFEYDVTAPPTPQPSPPQSLLQPPPLKASTSERSLRVMNELQAHLIQVTSKLEIYKSEIRLAERQQEEYEQTCIIEKNKTTELRSQVAALSAGLESKQALFNEIRKASSDTEDRVRSLKDRVAHLRSGQIEGEEREASILMETQRYQEMKLLAENRMEAAISSLDRLGHRYDIETAQLAEELHRLRLLCQRQRLVTQCAMADSEQVISAILDEQKGVRQSMGVMQQEIAEKYRKLNALVIKELQSLRQQVDTWDSTDTALAQSVRECSRNIQSLAIKIHAYQQQSLM
ncbi:hypothetical protein K450DRAFT_256067 [Umbelopsis ramanniana AG]|uniref:Uncharacterized protein n=1 Tax=Umbelopsis ramanniana AG TaxID=1314678 RepID=A0AAD5E3V0_UMBRA|nr:uncharacterized protein K450DRAFT_256067 [Umbelopsis ramanniana AG]KAI8576653.1 hypothetical protein K450DRAFT_256067 [Umbelopsis ramanniana AG]